MFRSLTFAATIAVICTAPALAEQRTATRPIEAINLHDGPLDMVAYFVQADQDALEMTATFAPRRASERGEPLRVVMGLADGDEVAFAMPGYPEALYRFTRSGQAVTISVALVDAAAAAWF